MTDLTRLRCAGSAEFPPPAISYNLHARVLGGSVTFDNQSDGLMTQAGQFAGFAEIQSSQLHCQHGCGNAIAFRVRARRVLIGFVRLLAEPHSCVGRIWKPGALDYCFNGSAKRLQISRKHLFSQASSIPALEGQ
jgi:hypothetical protein